MLWALGTRNANLRYQAACERSELLYIEKLFSAVIANNFAPVATEIAKEFWGEYYSATQHNRNFVVEKYQQLVTKLLIKAPQFLEPLRKALEEVGPHNQIFLVKDSSN